MITNTVIKQETEELVKLIKEGDIEIPSFWSCAWPGLLFALSFVLFSLIVSNTFTSLDDDAISHIPFSLGFGLLSFLGITNARSLYLSIPNKFRKKSKVICLMLRKVRSYLISYILIVALLGLAINYVSMPGFVFSIVNIFLFVIITFIFGSDIGRYRLSAFNAAMELIKTYKKE